MIAFEIRDSVSEASHNDMNGNQEILHNTQVLFSLYTYRDDVRDPFRPRPTDKGANSQSVAHAKTNWQPPPFRLTGVLRGAKARSVSLEAPDGRIFFLRAGDTALGVRLLHIEDRRVTYSYQKVKGEWKLQD
jgi:hypothetical protein